MPARIPSKPAGVTVTFSPSNWPRALARSTSMPTGSLLPSCRNSFGGYVASVATIRLPDCLYLSGSAAASASSFGRLRFSGPGADPCAVAVVEPPEAAPEPALAAGPLAGAAEVVSDPGWVVLAPHPLARSSTPRAATRYRERCDDEMVFSKLSPDGEQRPRHYLDGLLVASCHGADDQRVSDADCIQ